jgi:hypothetical protein
VRKLVRAGSALLVIGALVVGTAGVADAKAKKVSTKKYAKTLCETYSRVIDDLTSFAGSLASGASITDPASFQADTITKTEGAVAGLAAAEAKLKKTYPDVDKGKKIAKSLVANATELKTKLSDALEKFRAADPNGVAFTGDVTVFSVAIRTIAVGLSDPFSKITDQDLIAAFGDIKSCKNVVTVI